MKLTTRQSGHVGEFSMHGTLKMMARNLEGRDWHKLRPLERVIVAALEDLGYLKIINPPNGFVGKAS